MVLVQQELNFIFFEIIKIYKVLFFLDDQPLLWKRSLNGEKINSPEILIKYKDKIDYVLLAIPSLTPSKKKRNNTKIEQI